MIRLLPRLRGGLTFILLTLIGMSAHRSAQAQVFWAEDFAGPTWTLNVPLGAEGVDANFFVIADYEGGGITPNLGAPGSCGVANNTNNTLHITSVLFPTAGASYDAGGLCPILSCPLTNKRAESPTINCLGKSNISVSFNYIENGDGSNDDASFWYYDGSTWTMLDNMPKTLTGCGGQGLWTSRTVSLPASADNNPNVKIGFSWVNNDDGVGTDPSFAVDDIQVSTPPAGNTITTGNLGQTNLCACNTYTISYTATGTFTLGNAFTAQLSNAAGSFASPVLIGTLASTSNSGTISITIPCNTPNGTQYRIRVVGSNPVTTGSDNGTNLNISSNPAAPTGAAAVPSSLCDPGGTVQLTAVSSGNSINWYTAPTGGNYVGNTPSGGNLPVNLTATTTYYAEALIGGVAVSGSSTFGYTGGMQTFVVPPGITSVQIECWGGSGSAGSGVAAGVGGLGGYASGTLAVTPGQVLNIFVGGQANGNLGGYNGGGNGGDLLAGGGGGASDVRAGGTAPANRVVVAGGGGGGGNSADGCTLPYAGGSGGGGGGIAGTPGVNSPFGAGGAGGTVGVGGVAGAGCGNFLGSPGTVPNGGNGQALGCTSTPGGGGGGGGFVQGGGGGGGSLGSPACTGNDKGGGGGGAGGSSYTAPTVTNPLLTPAQNTGNGSVVITWSGSPTSCVSGTRTPITVAVNPNPTVTATPANYQGCPGSSLTLSGNGASTYSWSGPQAVTNGVAFNVTSAGTYTVTGTSAANCTATSTVSVSLFSVNITASATPAASVCVGNQVTLNGGGGVSYAWTGGMTNGAAFTPALGTTTYTVTGTDANNCTATSTISVTANALPAAPSGLTAVPASLCVPGGTVQLTATSAGNTINWYDAPTGGTLLGSVPSGTPYSTTVSVTDTFYAETSLVGVGACVSVQRAAIVVMVHPLPVVSANPAQVNGCNNVNVTLNGVGAQTYTWAGPQTIQNNVPFVATASGTYTVTGTDVNGCSATATAVLTVNPLPTVGATVAPAATICQGQTVTLSGTGATTYTWSGGITNGTPFAPPTSGTYTVTGADAIGCTNTSSIIVTVNPSGNPIVALNTTPTVVYAGNSILYTAVVPASVGSYQLDWYKGGSFYTTTLSPANTITLMPNTVADSVFVVMTPLSGCYFPLFAQSNTIEVRFPMDVEEGELPADFVAYPVPTSGMVFLQGIQPGDELLLTDVVGRQLIRRTFGNGVQASLDLQAFAPGMYHARFARQGKFWTIRLVKE